MQTPDWFRRHHGPEFVAYLGRVLSPSRATADDITRSRADLLATSIVTETLAAQRHDGGWDLPSPEAWYLALPRRLELLLDYGFTLLDEPLERGVRHLLSLQRDDGSFAADEPDAIPYDEAYNAGCIRVLVRVGLRHHPAARRASERLLAARRHDGGWSTLPAWMRRSGAPVAHPEPSCPICTDLAVFALGAAIDLPLTLRDEFLGRYLGIVASFPPAARAGQWRRRIEFMANQGMRAGDPLVDEALRGLAGCRESDGRFGHHESPADFVPPELAELLCRHLRWRMGDGSATE